MRTGIIALCSALCAFAGLSAEDVAKYDENMVIAGVVTNGLKWIDGKVLPIEGRAFDDVEHYYDRLPAGVTTNVNGGVRSMKHHTSGMQFRFATDSKNLAFKWVPYNGNLSMDHMPSTGVSGIDVYRYDETRGKWLYVKTGRIHSAKGGGLKIPWTPGTPCLVNLPLYNGVREFSLGIDPKANVLPLPPRRSGVTKPVVFYGTSITHGGCASRPGLGFVNIVGREIDVPVVNLGFSGSGFMEFEMSDHLARIDASCYVLDCLWNMGMAKESAREGRNVDENYEPFIRNLRAKRPDVPIVMAEMCDVYCDGPNAKDKFVKALYDKLVAEGWKNLVYLPKTNMFADDLEGTVDGCHPNDWGMKHLAVAFGNAVRSALASRAVVADAPVAFKDAGKIKSWDAWSDKGKTPTEWTFKECRCVTKEKIDKMGALVDLEPAGKLKLRSAKDIKSHMWSIGCETMDRDYAEWDQYKQLLPDLGATRGRLFSGWAKTEQKKGVYDFTWLDPQVHEMAAMGIKPWICISYGNPVWGSDFRLGMKVRQITDNPEALAAWLRYVKTLVARYKDVVDEWEIWNEPFGQRNEYATLVFETAKAVREVQPNATCIVTAILWNDKPEKNDYLTVLEKLKKENALDLVKWWVYHPYKQVPEDSYGLAMKLRKLVKSYSPAYDVFQGETGCPSQLEFNHAMCNIEWTEYAQAKWDLRQAIGDYAHNIPSSCFTFIDLQYTFMLQSFGLVRSNTLKQPVYRRPSFFAMQNVYSFFDESVRPVSFETREINGKTMAVARFEKDGRALWSVWFSGERPCDRLEYEFADLSFLGDARDFVWMDFMRGDIGRLPSFTKVPVWDSPVLLAPGDVVPR